MRARCSENDYHFQLNAGQFLVIMIINFDYYSYQEYEYSSDENGSQVIAKLTKYGSYKTSFGSVNRNGARYYFDPSF